MEAKTARTSPNPRGRAACLAHVASSLASPCLLKRRVAKAGMAEVVDARAATAESMGITDLYGAIDFTAAFEVELEAAGKAGFEIVGRPAIRRSVAALLKKTT